MLLHLVECKKNFADCSLARTKHQARLTDLKLMFLKFSKLHHLVAAEVAAKNQPELADLKMCLKFSKIHHLLAAEVLALVLHPLDQLGGEQGGGVAQVAGAGGALCCLICTCILSQPVSAGATDKVPIRANRDRAALPGEHQLFDDNKIFKIE